MKHHPQPASRADHEPDSAASVKTMVIQFLERHQPAILTGIATVLVVLIAVSVLQRRDQRVLLASEMLGRARTAQDFEEIVERYGRTPAAPLAMLQAARAYFEDGNIQKAAELYEQFSSRFPNHAMAATAVLGRLHCHEVMGRVNDALQGYRAFRADRPGHHLLPQAMLGEARGLDQSGQLDAARIVYEDFIALNPESRWVPQAEQSLQDVNRRLRRMQGDSPDAVPPRQIPDGATDDDGLPPDGAASPAPDTRDQTPDGEAHAGGLLPPEADPVEAPDDGEGD